MLGGSRLLPAQLAERARDVAEGRRQAVEPRDAATVVLVRNGHAAPGGAGSLEVYFLRRHPGMAFAAGMAVFPGGGVDPRDHHDDDADGGETPWAGPAVEEWSERLGVEVASARALVYAAVRETFEESGVLLAGPSVDSVVADTTDSGWEADRVAMLARRLSLTDLLRRRALVVRTDLLTPWACWVTPAFEARRYRTWFFLAELPEGQRTRDVSTESQEVMWLSVRDALTAAHEQRLLMLPPQYYTCAELYAAGSTGEAARLGGSRPPATVEPTVRFDGATAALELPAELVALGDRVREALGAR